MEKTDNQVPFSESIEKAYIGNLLQGNPMIARVDSKAFYSGPSRKLFDTIIKVISSGRKVDLLTVKAQLETDGALAAVPPQYLIECVEESGYDSTLQESFAKTISELKARRDLIVAGEELARSAKSGGDVPELMRKFTSRVEDAGSSAVNDDN